MFILPQTTWKLKAQEDQMANELRYKGLHQVVWTQRKMPPSSVDQLHQTLWIK